MIKIASGILKNNRIITDGKGQYKIVKNETAELKKVNLKNFILEEILDFEKEISVIICRKIK